MITKEQFVQLNENLIADGRHEKDADEDTHLAELCLSHSEYVTGHKFTDSGLILGVVSCAITTARQYEREKIYGKEKQ